jgi:FKBP-type peptidyl-prolyl cis-trans isomerase FkpA
MGDRLKKESRFRTAHTGTSRYTGGIDNNIKRRESIVRKVIVAVLTLLLAIPALAAEPPKTEEQKTLYAVGIAASHQLSVFTLTPAEFEFVREGFIDGVLGNKPQLEAKAYTGKIQQLALARRKAQAEKMAPANEAFLASSANEKGARKTGSGLVLSSLKEGSGAVPGPTDTVKVHYRGLFHDGNEFANSYLTGKPVELRVDGTIPCWKEGLQMMKVGGKARLVCPAAIAYGESGAGDLIPPGATLAFEVELLEIRK